MKRLQYIWLICGMLTFSASAQDSKLDMEVSVHFDKITLKQALANISSQYGIRFSYSDSNIPVDRIIDAEFKNVSLRSLLRQLLQQNEINFSIIENQIVLFPFNIDQTITIKGKVIDRSTSNPVPYAHIALSGTSKGTSSNQDGEFELVVSKLPSELIVSHLNHEKKLIHVYEEDRFLEIGLIQAPRKLDEITIKGRKNKNTNFNHIKKAYDRLSNLSSDSKYGKAFYRQKSSREGNFTEIFELFYDIRYSENGIEDWAVQEGRYAFQQENEYDIFLYNKNFTLLSRMFPISQPITDSYLIPVNADVKKYFNLDLKEVLNYDNRLIGVLAFTPKNSVNIPTAEGELYIDLESFQVLKMKGTFRNEDLDIIGFADKNSQWENYQLDFQISFIDDPADELILDFVQIDHQFDYYFNDEFIGHINTSSLLTFYEHYSPVKNKALGGSINFETSDMEVIDAVGYNPDFWSANPIVKRTPLEEKLINDFEKNEAFGVVFLNNEEEVVLLPDNQKSEKVRAIIAAFEKQHATENDHLLYLQFDKLQYDPGEPIQFTAFVLDRLTRKPFVIGSVLNVELFDHSNNLTQKKSFDINQGSAYGEIYLEEGTKPGLYTLKASTNISSEHPFEQLIPIGIPGISKNAVSAPKETEEIDAAFFIEGRYALEGINTNYVLQAASKRGEVIKRTWQITDQNGQLITRTSTNSLGTGVFSLAQYPGNRYFLKSGVDDNEEKWAIPEAHGTGLTLHVDQDKSRSVRISIHQKPSTPKTVNLLFTANGKVVSFFEKNADDFQSTFELPRQHLPNGVITLFALNETGIELSKRSFFLPPEELSIQLESVSWKSKRSNRVQLDFRISDQENQPAKARLSAICSTDRLQISHNSDIRNQVYFAGLENLQNVDLNMVNDSVYSLIDALLIVNDARHQINSASANSGSIKKKPSDLAEGMVINEPIVAEVSISGHYSPDEQEGPVVEIKKMNKSESRSENYWIPQVELNEAGIASFYYKIHQKNKPFYVRVQGISANGKVGYGLFKVDPLEIKK